MNISTRELVEAKEVTAELLEQLGLESYLFDVEPRDAVWEVHVDCAVNGAWQSSTLLVDRKRLRDSAVNAGARTQLLAEWRKRLAASPSPVSAHTNY